MPEIQFEGQTKAKLGSPEARGAVETVFGDAFNEFLEKQSVVSATTTPAGFAAFLQEDRKAAEELIKLANSKRETYKAE